MTIRFLDASVLIAAEDPGDANHHDAVRLLVSPEPLATIDLARYEPANVAMRAWSDAAAAHRLSERFDLIEGEGHLVRADQSLIETAVGVADEYGISIFGAAYVAAARRIGAHLVSCDVRDLVGNGFAVRPGDAP